MVDQPAVQCDSLAKSYGAISAITGISFAAEEGTLMALVGPSGCGKTTTLRVIAGFEAPDTGTVVIRGNLVNGPSTFLSPDRRKVGMVFQDYALFPHLSVRQNIGFGLPRGAKNQFRVDEVLDLVGLSGAGGRQPHELSGGEQQRVALARALAPSPAVVLMDEPFSNLDASLRAKVRTDVRHILKAAGTAAIFVTHDQDEALSLADEVGIMLDGCVVQVGAPSNVYAHPESLAVASFLGDANILPGEATNGRVTTELGILNTTKPSSGHVSVLVRPEEVNLGHVVDDQERYQVIEKDFYGHDQMLQLRMPSGRVLRVRCGPGHLANPGDWVSASVSTPVTTFADHR